MRTPKEVLLHTLETLGSDDFKKFKWFMSQNGVLEGFPAIPWSRLENADRINTVDQMVLIYCINTVYVTKMLLVKIDRNDLVESFPQNISEPSGILSECQCDFKSQLKKKFQRVFEGIAKTGNQILLNQIYTELYITEGRTAEVNDEHEVRQIETASRKPHRPETSIRQEDIFKLPLGRDEPIRTVMTMGVAGIGKTVLTQKFTLDWAEDKANQDIKFTFPFTFRELNVLKEKKFSLVELIYHFFKVMKEAGICRLEKFQVVFILDGLDECRLPLDFHNNETLTDVMESTSVDVLLTNLISGNLLPSARLWITTRPAAASQIPPDCVDITTEVRGFTDPQKEEYFRKRFREEEQAIRIISHIKSSRSLHIMCHIPVFCWITAKVLQDEMKITGELPKTLTEMYIHFLVIQTKVKEVKYVGGPAKHPDIKKVVESLGKLAFEQLQKGNLIFYESDLRECDIDIKDASWFSGVFTEIFREEREMYDNIVYSFVHLSVQEFLAAVYMTHCHTNRNIGVMQDFLGDVKWEHDISSLDVFLKKVLKKSLDSKSGHLDLLVRFLHGLSVKSNRDRLVDLLGRSEISPETIQRVIGNLKDIDAWYYPDRIMNIFQCLMEMNDSSAHQEIKKFLHSKDRSVDKLSATECSALAYMLQMSEEVLDELDLQKSQLPMSEIGRLLPAVRNCRRFRHNCCDIPENHCGVIASALKSEPSHLIELFLGGVMEDSGLKLLCSGLEHPNCRLETLNFKGCGSTEAHGEILTSGLKSNMKEGSHLKELELSSYTLKDSGMSFLESPNCGLKTLRLFDCGLVETHCEVVASALKFNLSCLKELDLSYNSLKDSGVKILCDGLQNPNCTLETLSLANCDLSGISCSSLVSALKYNPSHLRHLNLNTNDLYDSGVKQLCGSLEIRHCRLETLRLECCRLTEISCGALASALRSSRSCLRELDLTYNQLKDSDVYQLSELKESRHFKLEILRWKSQ